MRRCATCGRSRLLTRFRAGPWACLGSGSRISRRSRGFVPTGLRESRALIIYPAMVQFAVRPRRTVGDGDRPGGSRLRLPAAPAARARGIQIRCISAPRVSKLHYVSRTWSNVVIYHDRTLTLLAFVVLGQCQPVPGPRQPTARVPTWHVARRGGRRRWVGVVCASPHRYPCSTHGLSRPQRGPGPPGGNTRPAAGRCSSCAKGPSW